MLQSVMRHLMRNHGHDFIVRMTLKKCVKQNNGLLLAHAAEERICLG